MTTTTQLRNLYARESVTTASPATLLTMLYDRLLKDLTVAERAVVAANIQGGHDALIHAQEIIAELFATLDLSVWPEGESLQRLYVWMTEQLVIANTDKDAGPIRDVRAVVEPLAQAWHQAAIQTSGAAS
ncbi:MAG: flagellar export chaperone FliS [Austwickia sp.]|jgi:flagellar secretion chaperone FliS|nr:flagellar export chaperone FliS [Austwickia sp.]MBK8436471.1 flagellar export chaperone FliS [Austwickia sp.]